MLKERIKHWTRIINIIIKNIIKKIYMLSVDNSRLIEIARKKRSKNRRRL
jgi:hypothetical protein